MFAAFRRYVDDLEAHREASSTTVTKRERILGQFSEWLTETQGVTEADDVRNIHVTRYVDHLVNEGYAENTILRSFYSSVSAALNWVHNERLIDENPIDRINKTNVKKKARNSKTVSERKRQHGGKDHLTKDEVYELVENVPEPTARNELLIKLLFWTGVRVSEVVGISLGDDGKIDGKNSDINPEKPSITVYAPKTEKTRVVSYPRDEINPLLRDWVNHGRLRYKYADEIDQLLLGRKGRFTKSGVEDVVDKAAVNAGMQEVKRVGQDGREYKRITPHLLRHSHAMYQHNERDVPLDKIKDHLGHDSVDTTEQFYAESTDEEMINTFGR